MTPEDHHDLRNDAQDLAYLYIRLSGLSDKLATNDDDDVLATQIAERIMSLVEGIGNAMTDAIEAQSSAKIRADYLSTIIERYREDGWTTQPRTN